MGKIINNLNDWIAIKVTLLISNMWCVYFFMALVTVPLLLPSTSTVIQYVSSAYLQLIFLPLILVGQGLLSKASEARAQEDHDTIMAEMAEMKAMHAELHLVLAPKGDATVVVEA